MSPTCPDCKVEMRQERDAAAFTCLGCGHRLTLRAADFGREVAAREQFLQMLGPHEDCAGCSFAPGVVPCPYCHRCGDHCLCAPDVDWVLE